MLLAGLPLSLRLLLVGALLGLGGPELPQHRSVVDLLLTVVPSHLHLNALLVLAVHAFRVTPTVIVLQIYYFLDELLGRDLLLISGIELNVMDQPANFFARVLLENHHCLVELRVVHEGSLYLLQEMVTESLGEGDPDVGHAIADE